MKWTPLLIGAILMPCSNSYVDTALNETPDDNPFVLTIHQNDNLALFYIILKNLV
ncbi:MAG: hypothetical protein LEGION0403_FIIPPAGN_00904 [Legionella sp.]